MTCIDNTFVFSCVFLQAQEGRLSQQEAATIMRCVLEFLQDCHARNICYGEPSSGAEQQSRLKGRA
jgi:hypothetical protein